MRNLGLRWQTQSDTAFRCEDDVHPSISNPSVSNHRLPSLRQRTTNCRHPDPVRQFRMPKRRGASLPAALQGTSPFPRRPREDRLLLGDYYRNRSFLLIAGFLVQASPHESQRIRPLRHHRHGMRTTRKRVEQDHRSTAVNSRGARSEAGARQRIGRFLPLDVRCSMLDVQCSMFERAFHHPIRVRPVTWSKWASRLMTGSLCWRAMAAIHRSFIGMGVPADVS